MHKKAAALASAVPKSALVGEREKQFYVTIFSRAKMDLDIARNRTSFWLYCSSKWNVHMRNNIHLNKI